MKLATRDIEKVKDKILVSTGPIILDTTPPNPPTSLVVSDEGNGEVTIQATASVSSDVASYNGYYSNGGGTIQHGTEISEATLIAGYTFDGLTNNTTYTFWFTAVDEDNNESVASSTVEGTPSISFPSVISTRQGTESGDTMSHDILLPATVNAGDLLLLCWTVDSTVDPIASPSGWTKLKTEGAALGGNIGHVLAKVADGTEADQTITITTSSNQRSAYRVFTIEKWFGALSGIEVNSTGSSLNPPSLTVSWGETVNLWIAYLAHNGSTHVVTAYPSNYTNGQDVSTGQSTSGAGTGTARRENEVATEDPGAFTCNGDTQAFTIGIRPAS